MENYFLNNVNKAIGENMRFVRNYQVNPQQALPPQAVPVSNPMEQMMLLLLFPLLLRMMETVQVQLPTPVPVPSNIHRPDTTNPALVWLEGQFQPDTEGAPPQLSAGQVQDALDAETFSEQQLGEALMALIHKADDEQAPSVLSTWQALVTGGQVNAVPFIQEKYLERLTVSRREALTESLAGAGLHFVDGKPNTPLMGALLRQVYLEDAPLSSGAAQSVFRHYQARLQSSEASSDRDAMEHLLALAQWGA